MLFPHVPPLGLGAAVSAAGDDAAYTSDALPLSPVLEHGWASPVPLVPAVRAAPPSRPKCASLTRGRSPPPPPLQPPPPSPFGFVSSSPPPPPPRSWPGRADSFGGCATPPPREPRASSGSRGASPLPPILKPPASRPPSPSKHVRLQAAEADAAAARHGSFAAAALADLPPPIRVVFEENLALREQLRRLKHRARDAEASVGSAERALAAERERAGELAQAQRAAAAEAQRLRRGKGVAAAAEASAETARVEELTRHVGVLQKSAAGAARAAAQREKELRRLLGAFQGQVQRLLGQAEAEVHRLRAALAASEKEAATARAVVAELRRSSSEPGDLPLDIRASVAAADGAQQQPAGRRPLGKRALAAIERTQRVADAAADRARLAEASAAAMGVANEMLEARAAEAARRCAEAERGAAEEWVRCLLVGVADAVTVQSAAAAAAAEAAAAAVARARAEAETALRAQADASSAALAAGAAAQELAARYGRRASILPVLSSVETVRSSWRAASAKALSASHAASAASSPGAAHAHPAGAAATVAVVSFDAAAAAEEADAAAVGGAPPPLGRQSSRSRIGASARQPSAAAGAPRRSRPHFH